LADNACIKPVLKRLVNSGVGFFILQFCDQDDANTQPQEISYKKLSQCPLSKPSHFVMMNLRGEIETPPGMVISRKDCGSQFYLDQLIALKFLQSIVCLLNFNHAEKLMV